MTDLLFHGAGMTGVGLTLAAYFLLERGALRSDRPLYPLMNMIGGLLIILSLLRDWNLASFVLNVIWSALSLYGLIRALRQQA